jgi:nitroreductase
MLLTLSPDELLTTTRAVRKRLDLDRPVEREVITECLELALQAPSGGNHQGWHWVFVSDPATKTALADLYRECFYEAYRGDTGAEMTDPERRMLTSAQFLADHFAEVPTMLVACQWGRVDAAPNAGQAGYWGSILPAVWSLMLALRSRGLGSAWTTLHLNREKEAAEVLGIPYDRCTQAGLFPIAYTKGTDFKAGPRQAMDDVVHWDRW